MLRFAARHGKWCLVLGLLAGLSWPGLAGIIKTALPVLISALLFLAAFRIGPDALGRGFRDAKSTLRLVALYQFALPLAAFALVALSGQVGSPAALALILVLAAPSVTGSPNFAILMGQDPTSALRLLVVGTALFPLTVTPVLWLLPEISTATVLTSTTRLVLLVLLASGAAFFLRGRYAPHLTGEQSQSIDGASAILLGVVVVGLMSAVGPLLLTDLARFMGWLAFACSVNFGGQMLAWTALRGSVPDQDRAATSIVAGNRNIALFLVALPVETTDALLEFVGCYQIPMYLTPIVMGWIYGRPKPG